MRRTKLIVLALLFVTPFTVSFSQTGVSTPHAHVRTTLPYSPCAGSPVLFTAVDTTGQYTQASYFWMFGDWSTAWGSTHSPTISHTYYSPGTYQVQFQAHDSLTQAYEIGVPTFIAVAANCISHDVISGSVYLDANLNGTHDPAETKVPNALLEITPGPLYTSTNAIGDYAINLPAGNYKVNLKPIMYHPSVNPSNGSLGIISTGSGTLSSGNNFGVQTLPNQQDVRVQLHSNPPVPGSQRDFWINYQNVGTATVSGTIELQFDPAYTLVNTYGGTANGNTITWNYTGLEPGDFGQAYATLNVSTTLPIGTAVNHSVHIGPISSDMAATDNLDTLILHCVSSYDPNDKQVSPAGEGPAGNIALGTDDLTYTVRFQNTGTYYATDVIIRDTLDPDLNPLSIEVLGSRHPMSWHLNQNELVFEFRNIMLPDSNMDEPGSHGWVRYRIDPKAGLPLGTEFTNSAAIYFDFNAPVITNTTLNTFANLVGLAPALNMLNPLTIAPHPVGSKAILSFSNPAAEAHNFTLMDLNGKVVHHIKDITASDFVLDRSDLPAGTYIYRLDNAQVQAISIGRLVVQ